MKGLIPLLGKEVKEQVRTYRFLIVAAVFVVFGISTPLLLKYLPQIMEIAGEGMTINMPPPTAAQSLAEYLGNIGQLGLLITVLMAMGAIANELKNKTAILALSKPVSRTAFVTAKLTALSLTFTVSLAVASTFCFAYSVWLIGPSSLSSFVGVNLLTALFLIFALALTLLCSSIFRSSLAAGGLALVSLVGLSLFGMLPVIGDYTPGKLLEWGSNLLAAQGGTYWGAVAVSIAGIIACVGISQRLVSTREI